MGADGGVAIFLYPEVEYVLSNKKLRAQLIKSVEYRARSAYYEYERKEHQRFLEVLKPKTPFEEIIKYFDAPWCNIVNITVGNCTAKTISFSNGDNVPEIYNTVYDFLRTRCTAIWNQETWT